MQNRFSIALKSLFVLTTLCFAFAGSTRSAFFQESRRSVDPINSDSRSVKPGAYFALVIGINDYSHLKKLSTAVSDANAIAQLLHDKYGFDVKLIHNATRDQIKEALGEYRRSLDPDASLLIYYAGHGMYDEAADKAYWLPADARNDDTTRWIIADDITTDIKVIPARHVLVISDSCYSGVLTREASPSFSPRDRERFIEKMMAGRSRTLMASGGKEPVADGGGAGHSVFADALIKGLAEYDASQFSAEELFDAYVRERVGGRSDQTPEYSVIRNSGHDSGDFVFERESANAAKPANGFAVEEGGVRDDRTPASSTGAEKAAIELSSTAGIPRMVSDLRLRFNQARDAFPQSGPASFNDVKKDVLALLERDPKNGTGWYFSGEIKRISNPSLFTSKSCVIPAALAANREGLDSYESDFYRYLDIEKSLPASETGGDSSAEICYERPSGFCPQRTAWINHLLANDLFAEAAETKDRKAKSERLRSALELAERAAKLYSDPSQHPGFEQCTSTTVLISEAQQKLSARR